MIKVEVSKQENLKWLEELGIDIRNQTYDKAVHELIGKYIDATDLLEEAELTRFKRELTRLQRPNN